MTSLVILFFTAVLVPGLMAQQEQKPGAPHAGDPAPDFTLPYATKDSVSGDKLTLSSLIGKRNIVLAFYPADWSGGCTKEMCTMRDNFEQLSKLNADILPISGDYEYSHHEWAKAQNFPFKMVSDHLHSVSRMYGSYNELTGFNRRTIYVIDKSGKIAYVDLEYKARDPQSFEKLQDALKNLP